ncbi:MAG: sulfite exporter TauE/SafE family protein [Phoenicibacter congonensis]|uniref:Probable membrane transporter protein n=1 Tax=Phoenicibacter congonensis TaxID=1944646 RepID=A0AA43U6D9_9ACTN|nr:sulfite exporter TauE/SafE family protein [Phoenicibacter congonensis]
MELFIIAALVGVGIGVLSGLLGIGGGTVMVPIFRLAFAMEPIAATATSLFTIIPTSISGMWKHHKNKTSLPKVGKICGLAGACLSPVGVFVASVSPGWAIILAAAIVIGYSAITMFKKALKAPKFSDVKKKADSENAGANSPCDASGVAMEDTASSSVNDAEANAKLDASEALADEYKLEFTASFVAKIIFIGAIAGFMSGYVGVGGGFIMVPLFISLLGISMRLASGTSLTAVCILAIPGVIEQAIFGNIHYTIGIAMACGSIPGAVLGANLVKKVPERLLRFIFAGFLLVGAVLLILNELNLF